MRRFLVFSFLLVCCWAFIPQSHIRILSASRVIHLSAEKDSSASVRTTYNTRSDSDNVFQQSINWITSDVGNIVTGCIGIVLILIGRLTLDDQADLGAQTRADLVGVLAAISLTLQGLTKLDVESAKSPRVALNGVDVDTTEGVSKDQAWMMQSMLETTPAKSAVLLQRKDTEWTIVARIGTLPATETSLPPATPILDKVADTETYLPTLQALPGRVEFTYLCPNTQAALLIPVGRRSDQVLVLGSDQAKSFTPLDIAWCTAAMEQAK